MNGLLIDPNGIAEVVEFPKAEKLDWYYEHLDCSYIDIVMPHGLEHVAKMYGLESLLGKFCLICDDEALLKEKPMVNPIASLLYGCDQHGQPLFGKVLVGKNMETDEGIETVGFDDGEMMLLQASINSLITMHNEKVKEDKNG
jgi:hypothetical protein